LSPSLPSSLAPIKPANPDSPGKVDIKMQKERSIHYWSATVYRCVQMRTQISIFHISKGHVPLTNLGSASAESQVPTVDCWFVASKGNNESVRTVSLNVLCYWLICAIIPQWPLFRTLHHILIYVQPIVKLYHLWSTCVLRSVNVASHLWVLPIIIIRQV